MLHLTAYRIAPRPDSPGAFDISDAETGRVVAVASPPPVRPVKAGAWSTIVERLMRHRLFQVVYAAVSIPVFLAWLIFGGVIVAQPAIN